VRREIRSDSKSYSAQANRFAFRSVYPARPRSSGRNGNRRCFVGGRDAQTYFRYSSTREDSVNPPSHTYAAPVTLEDRSEARNSTTFASSSGCPIRRSGPFRSNLFRRFGSALISNTGGGPQGSKTLVEPTGANAHTSSIAYCAAVVFGLPRYIRLCSSTNWAE
jgi:hypothetical protein